LGARVIEKHFTDNNLREGPDHKFAMNPATWKEMIDRSYELFNALGDGVKRIEKNETKTSLVQRRSLKFTKPLKKGHILSKEDLFPTRPITEKGIPPYMLNNLLGKELLKDVEADTQVEFSFLKQDK
jgi:sialic acid synthase SpsE